MNVAVGRRRLTTPAQVRRPLSVLAGALLAAAVFATPPVLAQQGSATPAASTAAGGAAAPHAKRAATHAAAKGESATMKAPANTKSQASYSIGVSMGDQLHSMGLTQDSVALERLSQGLRDAPSDMPFQEFTRRWDVRTALFTIDLLRFVHYNVRAYMRPRYFLR